MSVPDDAAAARELLAVWESWADDQRWRDRLEMYLGTGNQDLAERARAHRAAHPAPDALAALVAVTGLARRLSAMRWAAMADARAAGATWADIGAAIEMTRQRAHQLFGEPPDRPATDDQDHDGGPVPSPTERTAR